MLNHCGLARALLLVGFFLLPVAGPVAAQQGASPPDDTPDDGRGGGAEADSEAAPLELDAGGQALLYGTYIDPMRPSRFNPGNRLARIPERQVNTELRLDLSARRGACSATAKLRGRYDRFTRGRPEPDPDSRSETFLNTGGVRCRLGQRFVVSVGREVPQWGSSFYLSPSNPFFNETGKTDPVRELYGKDFVQLTGYVSDSLTLTLMRNYRAGRLEPDRANFSPATAVKLDWVGDVASGGAIVSHRDDGVNRLGLYGTYNYSGAVLFYTDLSMGSGHAGWFAKPDGGAVSWQFERSKRDDGLRFFSGLFGTAYTFESGWTATAEWLSGNEGYDRRERSAYRAAARNAARVFEAGGPAAAEAAGVLGTALAPGVPYLGRHTLFLQLSRNEWADKADVAVRWAKSFSPGAGSALSFSATYYLSGNLQAFAIGSRNFGGDGSDFGRLVRDSLSIGLRLYF